MGYIEDDSYVRVDFFKETGKYYTTESIKWIGYTGETFSEFEDSLKNHFGDKPRLRGMWAVCLKPYNKNSFPLMIKV